MPCRDYLPPLIVAVSCSFLIFRIQSRHMLPYHKHWHIHLKNVCRFFDGQHRRHNEKSDGRVKATCNKICSHIIENHGERRTTKHSNQLFLCPDLLDNVKGKNNRHHIDH